jgi:glycyl-tRNA synthetase
VAVFPLLSNRENLVKKAREIYNTLKNHFIVFYDESGSIGRRYRRQDEIGTPYCITVDFQTLEDNTVTIRDRDTTNQERINIEELTNYLKEKLEK